MAIARAHSDYIRELVHQHSAVVLDEGQDYLIEARLEPLACQQGAESLDELVQQLRQRPFGDLHNQVISALTTHETYFFRDPHVFDLLRTKLLPELVERRRQARRLHLWSAASASGQEAYSLAMLLADHEPSLGNWDVSIYVSDVSEQGVAEARAGRFSRLDMERGLPAPLAERHFRQEQGHWQADPELCRMLECGVVNLAGHWPPLPPMDLILLRNVLIYFDRASKVSLLRKVASQLKPDGYLFLGAAETMVNLDVPLELVRDGRVAYYRACGD